MALLLLERWHSARIYGYHMIILHTAVGMRRPQLKDLLADVVTREWYQLGLELTNNEIEMNNIDKDHGHNMKDALKFTFNLWLKEITDPTPSWWRVVDALHRIKENRLANDIEEKYC